MIAVLDTSAVIRLFIPDGEIPDELEDFLHKVEQGSAIAITPDLMWVEAANVLQKKQKLAEITTDESEELLEAIIQLPVRSHSHKGLLINSLAHARTFSLSVYDAIFLELARQKNARLFTADRKLKNAAKKLMGNLIKTE
jgi:predicted nucleic acid-binding protein